MKTPRAWRWAFGPGDFGGALLWTAGALLCVLAVPVLALLWLVIALATAVRR